MGYQFLADASGNPRQDGIQRTGDPGTTLPTCVPADPNSKDWQAYQAWLAFGNTPGAPQPLPVTVPGEVSNYQARAVLIQRGYFAKVDAALRGADQTQVANQLALAAWDYANVFERASPLIAAMAQVLNLSSADVDALFIAAEAI